MNAPRWQHLDTRETADGGTVVYHWRLDYPEKVCETSRQVVSTLRDRCVNHAGHEKPCQVWTRTPECEHRHLDHADPAAPQCLACGAAAEDVTDRLAAESTEPAVEPCHCSDHVEIHTHPTPGALGVPLTAAAESTEVS